MRKVEMLGLKFSRLTVLECLGTKAGKIIWKCRCDCGKEVVAAGISLRAKQQKSCGCLRDETSAKTHLKHGHVSRKIKRSTTYSIWQSMIRRCHTPTTKRFSIYGGRGISVCAEWRTSYAQFLADMGEHQDGMSIDRIDNDKGYEPGNCKWSNDFEQANNTRFNVVLKVGEVFLTMAQFASHLGVRYRVVQDAVRHGLQLVSGVAFVVAKRRTDPVRPEYRELNPIFNPHLASLLPRFIRGEPDES